MDQPREITRQAPRVQPGPRGWTALSLGIVFSLGAAAILAALLVPESPFYLGWRGFKGFMAGWAAALLALMGLGSLKRGVADLVRRLRARRGSPWLTDYSWSSSGQSSETLREVLATLVMAAVMALFLAPFHYIVLDSEIMGGPGGWMGRIIFGLVCMVFDLAILGIAGAAAFKLVRSLRFGAARLRFERFPFFLGDRLEATLPLGAAAADCERLEVTLRCLRERVETRQTGDSTNQVATISYELHQDTAAFPGPLRPGPRGWPVAFDLPAGAPPTELSAQAPTYWEVEVHAVRPGLDFHERYLVPVYAREIEIRPMIS